MGYPKGCSVVSVVFLSSLLTSSLFAQTYTDDSLTVRSVLDAAGLPSVSVKDVAYTHGGRIDSLDLHRQELDTLSPAIGELEALRFLDLRFNNLESVPAEIGKLIRLEMLDLRWNSITEIPSTIGDLRELVGLGLTSNRLSQLPEAICSLVKLQFLHLEQNELTALPDCIGQLTALMYLPVSYNSLETLPTSVWDLRSLEWLNASNNRLRRIPEFEIDLLRLERLDLERNELNQIPASISKAVALKHLRIFSNHITALPSSIMDIPGLSIEPSHNRLCALSPALEAWVDAHADREDWRETQFCDSSAAALFTRPEASATYLAVISSGVQRKAVITYALPSGTALRIEVYDALGRLLTRLFDETVTRPQGNVVWHARDYAAGVYYVSMSAGNGRTMRPVVLR